MEKEEKIPWSFLASLFGIICLVGTIATLMHYKPQYNNSIDAVEYMWGKLNYPATKKMVISSDSVLWVSACVDRDTTLKINRRVLIIKLNINQAEKEDIYLEENSGNWVIKPNNKEEELIKIAYMHF